jgi:predicted nucleic acid-binding protein
MTIRDERIVLDTNVWIFGLRRLPEFLACSFLLEQLDQLQIVIPLQVLRELQVNFTENELSKLFHLINQFPKQVTICWEKVEIETIHKYQNLGCDLGDAIIAAHLDELAINILISENRHFLSEVRGLPFHRLNSVDALEELFNT